MRGVKLRVIRLMREHLCRDQEYCAPGNDDLIGAKYRNPRDAACVHVLLPMGFVHHPVFTAKNWEQYLLMYTDNIYIYIMRFMRHSNTI